MERLKIILENVIKDKKKLKIFIGIELCIFTILITILTYTIIKRNQTIETVEVTNGQYEQSENINEKEKLVVNIEKEPAQELTEEEQEKAEEEENIEKEEKDKKVDKNSNSAPSGYGTRYYIKVNYGANVVTVYSQDSDGNYTVPVKAMVCSSGSATPKSGVYKTKSFKKRWGALFGDVWGQYTTQIVGNILFHSVPYLSADPSNLEYWEYDKLGTAASAGCIRLKVCDAKWIYDCIPTGTPVEFYSDSNPGPLGKPGAKKISGNEACRGWDPTDPNENNPWNNVSEQPKKEAEPQIQKELEQQIKKESVPQPQKEPVQQNKNNTETKESNNNKNQTEKQNTIQNQTATHVSQPVEEKEKKEEEQPKAEQEQPKEEKEEKQQEKTKEDKQQEDNQQEKNDSENKTNITQNKIDNKKAE